MRPYRDQFVEKSSSPRWLLDYGMNAFDGQAATELLIKVCKKAKDAAYSPFYKVALEEWRKNIETSSHPCASIELRTAVSVMVGLADTSVIEKSLHLHPLYGTPIIRGETLKGLLIDTAKRLQDRNGHKLLPAKDGALDVVAGTSKQPGVIDVLDAWYVPDAAFPEPLIMETDTVHHPKYYDSAGGIPPYDTEGPNPIRQLAVQGKFLFVVRGESEAWAKLALALLKRGLVETGVGARVRADRYGRFV